MYCTVEIVSLYRRLSGFPPTSLSWANTSCYHQKGHCRSDRWKGCEDKKGTEAVRNNFSFNNKGQSSLKESDY